MWFVWRTRCFAAQRHSIQGILVWRMFTNSQHMFKVCVLWSAGVLTIFFPLGVGQYCAQVWTKMDFRASLLLLVIVTGKNYVWPSAHIREYSYAHVCQSLGPFRMRHWSCMHADLFDEVGQQRFNCRIHVFCCTYVSTLKLSANVGGVFARGTGLSLFQWELFVNGCKWWHVDTGGNGRFWDKRKSSAKLGSRTKCLLEWLPDWS